MNIITHKKFGASLSATVGLTALFLVVSGGLVHAQSTGLTNPLAVDSIAGLIQKFVEIFSYFMVILAVLAFIWVGFQFVLAQGKPDKLKELKIWLAYIVVGVAIVIGARIMVNIIINTLEATGVVNQQTIDTVRSAVPN